LNRRHLLTALATGAGAAAFGKPEATRGIVLDVDLSVDPAREEEMLRVFHSEFRPAASKQPGFKDLQMLKLRSVMNGKAPEGANYRFVLSFETEEQRQHWVSTPVHKKLWPKIEATLKSKDYTVLLYDLA
jgi:heme-degrading monooxygenase HmoA